MKCRHQTDNSLYWKQCIQICSIKTSRMNEIQNNGNHLSYRFSDSNLEKCNKLLEAEIIKMWRWESECLSSLKALADKIESRYLASVIEQFFLESDLQVKRLVKINEVLQIHDTHLKWRPDLEVAQSMEPFRRAIRSYADEDLIKRWTLLLALGKLIHCKMSCYQSLISWSKFLRLYGVQELLEDSLDEYVQQDLLLNLLSENWES